MKVLIIANRDHQLLCNTLEVFREDSTLSSVEFDIISLNTKKEEYESDFLFRKIYETSVFDFILKIRFLRIIFHFINFRLALNRALQENCYDFIHVHYVENILLYNHKYFFNKLKTSLIVSVWGSDFYKASRFKRSILVKYLQKAVKVTIPNSQGIDDIYDYYRIPEVRDKIDFVPFFLKPLHELKMISLDDVKSFNDSLGIRDTDLVITIGYNLRQNQQHLEIIKEIENCGLFDKMKDKIHFILPLSYPSDPPYLQKIRSFISDSNFKYTLLTNFIPNRDVAILRKATSVFIQLQITDMLSASMIEHIYADNLVITGSWLPYKVLDEIGVDYLKIDSISDLPNTLYKAISNDTHNLVNNNSNLIETVYSKDNVFTNWKKTYDMVSHN